MGKKRLADELLIHETDTIRFEWFWDENEKMPGLDEFELQGEQVQARFAAIAEYWGELPRGQHLPKTMLNLENTDPPIYAIKAGDSRFPCFFDGQTVIVADHYKKQGEKLDKRGKESVKRAIAARHKYQRLKSDGSYAKRGVR